MSFQEKEREEKKITLEILVYFFTRSLIFNTTPFFSDEMRLFGLAFVKLAQISHIRLKI